MENSKETQLADMMDNIKEMRRAMDASTHAFRHIYRARNLRLLFLVAGCVVMPIHIAFAVNFAPVCFLFAFIAYISGKRSKYDEK